MEIYLDNSATTEVMRDAADCAYAAMTSEWGNPSSRHRRGLDAEQIMKKARAQILSSLGITDFSAVSCGRIIFTGSGTEADNLAVAGVAHAKAQNKGGRIITTDSEHPAVLRTCEQLAREGFDIVYIPTRGGILDLAALERALNPKTFLVSVMAVNNETGAAYDIAKAFTLVHGYSKSIITHSDAVQAYTHIPFYPDRLGCDLCTVSAHKIHGPKGIGALLVNPELLKAKSLSPVIFGGGQEGGLRSGTENVPGIAGFGCAAEHYKPENVTQRYRIMSSLRGYLIASLPSGVECNTPLGATAPHIISLRLPDIKSETMLNFLSEKGIYVSSGSACSSHGKKGSHVLAAFGLSPREADCTIRISLDDSITEEMISSFVQALGSGCESLAKIR